MGIKRIVETGFWTDSKVEEFSPEDKFFMLYLLTNPQTTQLGIYEISIKQAAFHMGYSTDTVRVLIERFENKYNLIIFSKETNEIAIKNFLKHSIVKGGAPVRDCLVKEIKKVKNKDLIVKVFLHIKNYENLNETVKNVIAEYEQKNGALDYSNTKEKSNKKENKDNDNDNDNDNENENEVSYHNSYNDTFNESFVSFANTPNASQSIDYQSIVDMFNSTCLSYPKVKALSDKRKKAIKARLQTYTIDDFKTLFTKAEASSFLKGQNNRDWQATFDWLIADSNMAKTLDGNYDNKGSRQQTQEKTTSQKQLEEFMKREQQIQAEQRSSKYDNVDYF